MKGEGNNKDREKRKKRQIEEPTTNMKKENKKYKKM